MRGRPLILLLWGIGQSLASYGALPPAADAHELSKHEKQQIDVLVEKITQALAQQTAQMHTEQTYYRWKIPWSFFEGGYVLLKLAALIVLVVIVYEIIVWLSHFLPRHGAGKIPSPGPVQEHSLLLPLSSDRRVLGDSSQECPDKAPPTITCHEPVGDFEFKSAARDLKIAFLQIDEELLKRVTAQIASAHKSGLDPAPLSAHAPTGTSQYPRVPAVRMYHFLMAQLAYAKSIGLSASLPEAYGQNIPSGH
jgi:hypothetical protein